MPAFSRTLFFSADLELLTTREMQAILSVGTNHFQLIKLQYTGFTAQDFYFDNTGFQTHNADIGIRLGIY